MRKIEAVERTRRADARTQKTHARNKSIERPAPKKESGGDVHESTVPRKTKTIHSQ